MLDKLKSLGEHQVLRFLLLGGFAAAVNWLVRFPLSAIMPIGAAVVLAYLIGMSAGFPLYRKFVFPGSTRPIMQQSLMFLAVNAVGAVAVLALTYLFLAGQSGFAYPEFAKEGLAHGFAIAVGAVINFFGHKTLTFSLDAGKRSLTSH